MSRTPRVPVWLWTAAHVAMDSYVSHAKRVGKPHRPSRRRVFDFCRIALLAKRHELDVDFYIWALFAMGGFRSLIGYKAMLSVDSANRVVTLLEWLLPQWESQQPVEVIAVDPHVEMTEFGERIKKIHRGHSTCITQIQDTGGYHPGSEFCRECEVSEACRGHLRVLMGGVDLASLRNSPPNEVVATLSRSYPSYPLTPLTHR